jgi:hypothetical protein
VCAFCGSRGSVEVAHINGHEEDTSPANLAWTCRACNVRCANTLRAAGIGRPTRQYNPTKQGGAANLTEWLLAVGAITPHRGAKYAAQTGSTMSVSDAVAMIRATPPEKRSEFGSTELIGPPVRYRSDSSALTCGASGDDKAEQGEGATGDTCITCDLCTGERERPSSELSGSFSDTPHPFCRHWPYYRSSGNHAKRTGPFLHFTKLGNLEK